MALTVHSMPRLDEVGAQARTRAGRWRMLAVVAVCASPVLASYFTFYVVQPRGNAYGELINPTVDLPTTLQLRDLDGKAVDAAQLKGQWLLTVVQDGACDAACEQQLFMQRQLREMTGKERDKVDKLWLITDETPLRPALREAITQGIPVTALRVSRESLEAWLKPAAGQRLQDHMYVVDPLGRWMMRVPPNPEPRKVKADLERLLKANAGWDRPGR